MPRLPRGKGRTVNGNTVTPPGSDPALELFPYGLMIAATTEEPTPIGMVLTWAMQVSFHPPLVAVAIESSSRFRDAVRRSGNFTLSFLPRESGTGLAKEFLRGSRTAWPESVPLARSPSQMPYLEGAPAWIGCAVRHEFSTGDHDTVIAEVLEWGGGQVPGDILTLRDTGWRYRR